MKKLFMVLLGIVISQGAHSMGHAEWVRQMAEEFGNPKEIYYIDAQEELRKLKTERQKTLMRTIGKHYILSFKKYTPFDVNLAVLTVAEMIRRGYWPWFASMAKFFDREREKFCREYFFTIRDLGNNYPEERQWNLQMTRRFLPHLKNKETRDNWLLILTEVNRQIPPARKEVFQALFQERLTAELQANPLLSMDGIRREILEEVLRNNRLQ